MFWSREGGDEETRVLKIPRQVRGPSIRSPHSAAAPTFRNSIPRKFAFLRRSMKNREDLPDLLFMKKLREFCIKQGGVGSQSGLNLRGIPEFQGNGGRNVPGFRRLPTPEKGGFGSQSGFFRTTNEEKNSRCSSMGFQIQT